MEAVFRQITRGDPQILQHGRADDQRPADVIHRQRQRRRQIRLEERVRPRLTGRQPEFVGVEAIRLPMQARRDRESAQSVAAQFITGREDRGEGAIGVPRERRAPSGLS